MRYLVTGHTGFKGAWLCLLLAERGHEVAGLALPALPGSLYERARVDQLVTSSAMVDIRDAEATHAAVRAANPDVVIHMAAQPLVRASYDDPRTTIDTNVMGTLSVLEAVAATPSVRASVIVTTDKVYRNAGHRDGYQEDDALGGHDPYSASKAMADLLVSSWADSFGGPPTAVARAGNVIGGGDVSADRLFPDLLRGFAQNKSVPLRYPDAVRPWQHVLDCLVGYLALVDALLDGRGAGAWNFGPNPASMRTVADAATAAARVWGADAAWIDASGDHPHEATLLTLDSSRARAELGWRDHLDFTEAVGWTVDWARRVQSGADPRDVTIDQVRAYEHRRSPRQ